MCVRVFKQWPVTRAVTEIDPKSFFERRLVIILDRKDPFAAYQFPNRFYKTVNANFWFFHIMNQLFMFMQEETNM